jgi:NAD(P)-dependent dehydrogenase (short-subunit alcohol dehydrogenase family)
VEAAGTALVTGAGRGLGRAVALELAAAGFDVVATLRDPAAAPDLEARAAARGGRLRRERLDVAAPGRFRPPDGLRVLVNNAGVESDYLPVEHLPLAAWRRVFETNLFGLVEITRRAIPSLRASGGGVICNVTSASNLAPVPFFAAYRASKAAVAALGESLRAELAPFGVRVLEVVPGPLATDLLAGSARPDEAAAHAAYRPMALRAEARRRDALASATPAEEAARRMLAAILDDAAPLRVACDPLAAALLEGWRAARDEDWMRGMLGAWLPGEEDPSDEP